MLLAGQQVAFSRAVNNIPVLKSDIIIGDKFQAARHNPVSTGLGKIRKWIDDIAGVVDSAFVGETSPRKPAVIELDRVALERRAGGLVHAFMTRTCKQQ